MTTGGEPINKGAMVAALTAAMRHLLGRRRMIATHVGSGSTTANNSSKRKTDIVFPFRCVLLHVTLLPFAVRVRTQRRHVAFFSLV